MLATAARWCDPVGIPEDHTGPWAIESQDGMLLAVYAPHRSGMVKPDVVVAPH